MHLLVTMRNGQTQQIPATPGLSIMNNIRDAGIDELVALCGGCLSCATCHVYVETHSVDMPEQSEDEDDLLESSSARRDVSRLSCQIPFTEQLSGAHVTIAPED